MRHLILLLASTAVLAAETYPAIHKKELWRDNKGIIEVTEKGIAYNAEKKKHSRKWRWLDIQYFDRVSPTEFVILTYKDSRLFLGRDKRYRFVLTQGELSDRTFAVIEKGLNRPVTDRVVPEAVDAMYTIPVKHPRLFGGSEGELRFTGDSIIYATDEKSDARVWRLDRDVLSVWSDDPYRLDIRVYDDNRREFSRTATYEFDLKEKLDPGFYRELKLKLYGLEKDDQVVRALGR